MNSWASWKQMSSLVKYGNKCNERTMKMALTRASKASAIALAGGLLLPSNEYAGNVHHKRNFTSRGEPYKDDIVDGLEIVYLDCIHSYNIT